MVDESSVEVADQPDQARYVARVDGADAGVASYRRDGDRLVFTHTEVQPEFEGQGLGKVLVRGALDDVRRHGTKIVPQCPFVARFIDDNPEYADLVASN